MNYFRSLSKNIFMQKNYRHYWAQYNLINLSNRTNIIKFLIIFVFSIVLFVIPFIIISYGYTPNDDVLRHVAKAVSGKKWGEILLLRESIPFDMDTHPGWHFVLSILCNLFYLNSDYLVIFSIVFLWLIFSLIPIFYFKRPESFICIFFLVSVFDFNLTCRLFWGRPYILTSFTFLSLCFIWDGLEKRFLHSHRWPKNQFIVIVFLTAMASWVHSTWYLLFLPSFLGYCTLKWRPANFLLCSTVCGVLIGASLTGKPIDYLFYQLKHLYFFMNDLLVSGAAVKETSKSNGSPLIVVLFLLLLLLNRKTSGYYNIGINNISFLLAITGWGLGLFMLRFWTDIGFPAFLYWASLNVQQILQRLMDDRDNNRLYISFIIAIMFFVALTYNYKDRWSTSPYSHLEYLKKNMNEYEAWLPAKGGVIYSVNMQVFYDFFYMFPKADWRYVLGFEHAIMTKDDLKIYNQIRLKPVYSSFIPWVEKMKIQDRIIVRGDQYYPDLSLLKWKRLPPYYWIGRL